jgi:glycosyltransferase involved in cell wall biosynthesis
MKRSRRTLEQADAVTFISSYMKKSILEVAPACAPHLRFVPNGVDVMALTEKITETPAVAKHHKLQPDSFVLFLGRLHNRKGVDILIESFRHVSRTNPGANLVIAGDGNEIATVRSQTEQSGISNRIHLVGSMQGADKLWLLQNCMCLVLPTRTRETFGLVLLEAMACGKPVIATRLGGILDLVDEDQNGLFVKPDDANDLAHALEQIIANPQTRRRLGSRSFQKAKQFDWPQVASKYLALFSEVLAQKRGNVL